MPSDVTPPCPRLALPLDFEATYPCSTAGQIPDATVKIVQSMRFKVIFHAFLYSQTQKDIITRRPCITVMVGHRRSKANRTTVLWSYEVRKLVCGQFREL
jgi:hypothetical protein